LTGNKNNKSIDKNSINDNKNNKCKNNILFITKNNIHKFLKSVNELVTNSVTDSIRDSITE